jgi:DNA-binding HxlR family transcriptional regulator
MKTYGELCGLAKTLDVVGDRWTLLIIRELSMRRCRYGDLRANLPGIASNLLAQRLRELRASGVIEKVPPEPPVSTPLYALTDRGSALVPTLDQLALWGYPLLVDPPATDERRVAWAGALVRALLRSAPPDLIPELSIRCSTPDETTNLHLRPDGSVELDPGGSADVTIEGDLATLWTFLTDPTRPEPPGSDIIGERRPLDRLRTLLADALGKLDPSAFSN